MRLEFESRQAQLLEVLDQTEGVIAEATPPQIVMLGELRLVTGEMLADHFRFKEAVFARLRDFGVVHVDRQVARCRSAMLALQVAHRFHCADWAPEAIARDWPGYVASTRRLIARLRALVELDRVQLNPLIDQLLGGQGEDAGPIEAASAMAFALTVGAGARTGRAA